MNRLLVVLALLPVLFFSNCGKDAPSNLPERPHQPWVFRSVLDATPRMLTVALHDNLWLAYSAQTGTLQKAWSGSVNFDGAVYTTHHGPQPSSLGDFWLQQSPKEGWMAKQNGKSVQVRVQYRGHRYEKGQVWINTDLLLPDGTTIKVSECPEYMGNEYGQTGLERRFRTEGVPAGTEVLLGLRYQSLPSINSLQTNGQLQLDSIVEQPYLALQTTQAVGTLALLPNAETNLKAFFAATPTLANANKVLGEEEEAQRPLGYRLIGRSDCRTCHNAIVQTVGPSYQDIARRYANTPENVSTLVNKVLQGGSGSWGEAAMTPHPDLPPAQATAMVQYIMSLDAEEETALNAMAGSKGEVDLSNAQPGADVNEDDFLPGSVVRAFSISRSVDALDKVPFGSQPLFEGIVPEIEFFGSDFGELEEDFALEFSGYLRIPKTSNYTFRLTSDDGSRMYIGEQMVINNDGPHGDQAVDGEVVLAAGFHPVRIQYFQGAGGRMITFKWRSFDSDKFENVPASVFMHNINAQPDVVNASLVKGNTIAGDGSVVSGVHPSYTLSQARPDGFSPKVAGMDFLPDGRLVISTWDAEGAVYVLEGVSTGDPSQMSYKRIAWGLAEPLGLKVVDGQIYVLQKQELTQLIDHDGDEQIDEYRTLSNDWLVSANFHEFAFGLAYKKPFFYAALAIGILPGGASAPNQPKDRGKAVRIHEGSGKMDIVSEGLRTPNGVGIGVDNEIFIADNQGDWLPSSKILHVTEGAFFGSRAVDSARVAQLTMKPPVVWLPQDEIGNSPSTPSYLNDGPYKGQMIHGEVTHGGVKRVFVEKVDGEYQGCVFRFIQGLEAGVNRMVWGPDTALYIGGVGSTGNWQHSGKLWYGLQRLKYNGQTTFEMLSVSARSNGVEITLTEPLSADFGYNTNEVQVRQWYYLPTHNYGGPKLDDRSLTVKSMHVSNDRKKIFLEIEGMQAGHVLHVRLPFDWTSDRGSSLWTTEAWYTMNRIPTNKPGFTQPNAAGPSYNTLTEAERKEGWKLLFDGVSTKGWHQYGNKPVGSSWKVQDNALMLDVVARQEGGWQAADGGDIVSEDSFDDFELRLEWKIAPCGNSGFMFHVVEDEKYPYPWMTGPELQVVDNTCHPDGAIEKHRAGDLYDLVSAVPITVKPSGEWNRVRLVVKDGRLQNWLNGRLVINTTLWDNRWWTMLQNSKWKDYPDFGRSRKGRISLQDHGDRVWFRNIKIRRLEADAK